jgi:GT2 family glycosyltransferase
MEKVDVVIVSWAKDSALLEVTRNGLTTLFSSETEVEFNAFVVESNPEISYDEFNIKGEPARCFTIRPTGEFGYHKFLNIGVRAGSSPWVVLCNSDLTYEKGWATAIIRAMQQFPQVLSASPWCPQTQGDNTQYLNNVYQGYQIRNELAGWCIFQQRKIYDIIGELDERFTFWYCDNDYAMELKTRGISHALVPASVVNHHHNYLGSTGSVLDSAEQERLTTQQAAKFHQKWVA